MSTGSSVSAVQVIQDKPHFLILDALRGIAAIAVVLYHLFESFASSRFEQVLNHGYLAVDFFFVLSGFVIAYAYDDRWSSLSMGGFVKRRLIRLQPMIVFGSLLGALLFFLPESGMYSLISEVTWTQWALVMILGMLMIPLPTSMDIRGWEEMYPLNGPAWSLFFEYLANIAYVLVLRFLSNRTLFLLLAVGAAFLIDFVVFGDRGDVIGGWSLNATHIQIGFVRLIYPFVAGMLLARLLKLKTIPHAYAMSIVALLAVLVMPRVGGPESVWMNGVYEAIVIMLVFPAVVALGACGEVSSVFGQKVSRFLGEISYPIYIVHFPLIYLHMDWVRAHQPEGLDAVLGSALVLLASVLLALLSSRFYDLPLRRWLNKRL